jgi:hypothetical protein
VLLVFAPITGEHYRRWARVLFSRLPYRHFPTETVGPPRFLANPRSHALLNDSGGPSTPGLYSIKGVAFPLQDRVGVHKK